jgi:phosphonate transport system ATP-binding protein
MSAALEVRQLSKTLKTGERLVEDVSFRVETGEFVALIGASGAGKSLTLRCILGLTTPTTGRVLFTDHTGKNHELTEAKREGLREARGKMGVIFQGANLVSRLTALENVMIGGLGRMHPLRAWLYGFTTTEAERALEALAQTDTEALAERVTETLSGGEMQRVAIARALYQRPDIFFADEPISALDPKNAQAVMEFLKPLAAHTPVLGVFHQPDMVARYCTRCIALKQGRVIYDGPPQLPQETLETIYGAELGSLSKAAE